MRIRLTIAAVLAVFAISAPLASAESTGVPGAVEGVVMIEHITEGQTSLFITVSQNACLEHQRHLDPIDDRTDCGGEDLAPLAPPVELIVGPPKGLEPGPPDDVSPPIDRGRPCDGEACLGL